MSAAEQASRKVMACADVEGIGEEWVSFMKGASWLGHGVGYKIMV